RYALDMDSAADWSALVGVIWSPSYRFEAGLTYRPAMAYHFSPDIQVTLPEIMGGTTITSSAQDLRVDIPQEVRLGCHWLASERLDIYFDAGWTQYSTMETLEITANDPLSPYIERKFSIPMEFEDVWHGHLGLEYLASGLLTLRIGGYYYSEAGQPEYESTLSPKGERFGITGGAGIHLFEWEIDLAAGQTIYPSRRVTGSATPLALTADTEFSEIFGSVAVRYRF
ncbi:outer membrane protein transport protein, partial [bacterium]|nr:outer membrane protein transport protein [candidate division CSSED10-310 bacterium]